jgi:hypothetical protein
LTNHEQILNKFGAEVAILSGKNQVALMKLRKELVEKYGEEGVQKVESKIEREWNEQHRA